MPFFGASTDTVVDDVESATNEKNLEEDWGLIISICDKAGKSSEDAKNYLRAIIKRLYNSDPHVGVKAVTLLDACIKNSGIHFHREVASRDFETDFLKLMTKAPPTVAKKLRESLKKWAENEFKSDTQLILIPTLYNSLKSKGYDFAPSETPIKKSAPLSKDPNVVESQEEEDQILKAIELSLKETSNSNRSPKTTTSSSLYPSVNMTSFSTTQSASAAVSSAPAAKEPRKVRALYDFEAAEDNELTFNSGEIIFVLDDSDENWWKGSNQRGEGLFPANFVTSDLSVEPEQFLYEKAKKMVQFKESESKAAAEAAAAEPAVVEINEKKIDRLLHLLHEADPCNPERDTEEMLQLEKEVNAMGPLVDSELERVDRKHAQLTKLSADLVEALSMYHSLMREPPQFQTINKMPPFIGAPGGYNPGLPPNPMYNGPMNMHHHPGMVGGHPQQQPPPPGSAPATTAGQDMSFMNQQQPQHNMNQGLPPPPGMGQQPPQSSGGMHMPPSHQHYGPPHPQQQQPPMHMMPPPGLRPRTAPAAMSEHSTMHFPPGGVQQQHFLPGQGLPQHQHPPPGMPMNFPPMPTQNGQQPPPQPPINYITSSTHIMH